MRACVLSHFSRVQLFVTPWTVAHQAPLSVEFSKQEHWSRLLCPAPGDPPDPGIRPMSLTSLALAGVFFTTFTTWEAQEVPGWGFSMLNIRVSASALWMFSAE